MNRATPSLLPRTAPPYTENLATIPAKRGLDEAEPAPTAKRAAIDSSRSTSSSTASVTQAPAWADFYRKDGRLSDLDITSFLSQLSEQGHEQISPGNAAYYLRMVWKNLAIKSALQELATPACLEKIESLCKHVDQGNWSAVRHRYMKDFHPEEHDLQHLRIKDMLLYANAANRISRAEFNTALMVLNIREQFELEIQPEYSFIDGKHFPDVSISTLAQKAAVSEFSLFESNDDGEKELSDHGYDYLSVIIDNLESLNREKRCLPASFDPSNWFDQLKDACKSLPDNLQVVFEIAFRPGSRSQSAAPNEYWEAQVCLTQMPLASMPLVQSEDDAPNTVTRVICIPSSAVMQKFLELLRPKEAVQPLYCLGTVGAETLAKLHLRGFHPVLTRDERVQSNLLAPHHVPAGSVYAAIHDEHFHCMAATLYSRQQRQFLCSTVPFVINRLARQGTAFDREVARHMVEHFVDLPRLENRESTLDRHVSASLEFIANELAAGRLVEGRSAGSPDHVDHAKQLASFFRKCLDGIRDCRTGPIQNINAAVMKDWPQTEGLLKTIEDRVGR